MIWLKTFLLIITLLPALFYQKGKVLTNEEIGPKRVAEEEPLLIFERTACLGQCPIYVINIYQDGKVVYDGRAYVPVTGNKVFFLKPEQVQQIVSDINKSKYFTLKDSYEGGSTDSPSIVLTVNMDGKKKVINHYLAAPDAPEGLKELESRIETIYKLIQGL